MREFLTYGSARGVPGDRHSYRDLIFSLVGGNLPLTDLSLLFLDNENEDDDEYEK